MELIDDIMMHITDYCKDPEAVNDDDMAAMHKRYVR